jgi:hypothetical protein
MIPQGSIDCPSPGDWAEMMANMEGDHLGNYGWRTFSLAAAQAMRNEAAQRERDQAPANVLCAADSAVIPNLLHMAQAIERAVAALDSGNACTAAAVWNGP